MFQRDAETAQRATLEFPEAGDAIWSQDSESIVFPSEGHWILKPQNSQLWYKTVNAWVDQWTKPKE